MPGGKRWGGAERGHTGRVRRADAIHQATRTPARSFAWPARMSRDHIKLHRTEAPLGYCHPGDSNLVLPWAAGEDLALTPKHSYNRSSWQRTPQRQCAVVIDRHVHKNGGSTMRDIFLENERLGYGIYQGYTQQTWHSDFSLIRRVAEAAVSEGRAPSQLLMFEAHFGMQEMSGKKLCI